MAQGDLRQIHNQLRAMQDKYTYFLLAVAASAIALSVQVTKDATLSINLIPLGLAVLTWGSSFYIGCRYLQYTQSYLIANHAYLQVKQGTHPNVGNNPDYINAASQGIKDAMEKSAKTIGKLGNQQFQLLVLGGILYVVWHLVEMVTRTLGLIQQTSGANKLTLRAIHRLILNVIHRGSNRLVRN